VRRPISVRQESTEPRAAEPPPAAAAEPEGAPAAEVAPAPEAAPAAEERPRVPVRRIVVGRDHDQSAISQQPEVVESLNGKMPH
jgi:hypothetical protein